MDNILECGKKIFTRQIISCSKLYIYHIYISTTLIQMFCFYPCVSGYFVLI